MVTKRMLFVTQVPENHPPPPSLKALVTHVVHRHTWKQNIHIHKIKINKIRKKKCEAFKKMLAIFKMW